MLHKMARIIMHNPTATAQEITERMGYAQSKSVYYWLRKAGFKGIVDFRQAVLTGNFPPPEDPLQRIPVARDQGEYVRRSIPIVGHFSRFVGPSTTGERPRSFVPSPIAISTEGYALVVDSSRYQPGIQEHDLLIVDPKQDWVDGDLILVSCIDRGNLLGHVYAREESLLLIPPQHPGSALHIALAELTVFGRVVGLIRQY
jgi:SOS-response transcriptional repressor LexA